MTDLEVFMLPPYPKFEEAPADQPNSELWDCPKCKNKCWMSAKKKGAIMFASCLGKEILLACYDCITQLVREEPEFFSKSEMIRL